MHKKSPNPEDVAIGARIRTRRQMMRMSQEKLAEACDLSFQQIQKYEKGANRVSGGRMSQIARALQCTPQDFFGREFNDAAAELPALSKVTVQIAQLIETLSPRARKLIRDQAVLLADLEGKPVEHLEDDPAEAPDAGPAYKAPPANLHAFRL